MRWQWQPRSTPSRAAAIEIADLIATGDLADAIGPDAPAATATATSRSDLDVAGRRDPAPLRSAAADRGARVGGDARADQIGDREAPLCVAIDPLDGSSNIDINMSVGTIFSILPARAG